MDRARELDLFRELLDAIVDQDLPLDAPMAVKERLDDMHPVVEQIGELVAQSQMADYFKVSTHRYAHYLASVRACVPQGGAILDVGNAPGHVAIGLSLLGYDNVTGLNLNEAWRALYPSPHWLDVFKVAEHDIEAKELPFGDATFDAIIFTEVLEHIALRDPVWLLKEMHRVLRPGAVVVFSTPNVCNISNLYALLHGRNVFWAPELFYGSLDRHNREYTVAEVRACFEQAGFQCHALWGINDHSNWRAGGNEFAYEFIATYGDAHSLTRNTTVGIFRKQ